jgi:F0F1-type ATP synthase gamma subunit
MQTKRAVLREVAELTTLKVLTKVYAEMAAMRMNKKRDEVLYARNFLKELDVVFADARRAYLAELKRKAVVGGVDLTKKITLLSHNGKNVAVFIAANTRLYGDIIQRTFEMFIEDVKVAGSEATVVGKIGRVMYEAAMGDKPYTYFDMPDTSIDSHQLNDLITHLVPYEEIHLYYGKFVNVVRQEPEMYAISAELNFANDSASVINYFIFEPSIEKVLQYFEGQIFGTLLEQRISESQLAKYAARLTTMDRAEQAIGERLKKLNYQAMRAQHYSLNKQIVNGASTRIKFFRSNHG